MCSTCTICNVALDFVANDLECTLEIMVTATVVIVVAVVAVYFTVWPVACTLYVEVTVCVTSFV